MNHFSATTPFRFVRRLAAVGQGSPSIYLLICDASAFDVVKADLAAEVQVQLGTQLRLIAASEVRPTKLEDTFALESSWPVVLISLDHPVPKLIDALDRNIVWLTRAGTLLLLASQRIAERALVAAPNLRNRLADVLAINLEESSGGGSA